MNLIYTTVKVESMSEYSQVIKSLILVIELNVQMVVKAAVERVRLLIVEKVKMTLFSL